MSPVPDPRRVGRLRALRRRVTDALAAADEIAQLRDRLAAVEAAYARDAQFFLAHRAAWDRERARLVAGLPPARGPDSSAVPPEVISLDERRRR